MLWIISRLRAPALGVGEASLLLLPMAERCSLAN